jgi:ligand-binding sensor domain-containing protein
MRFWSKKKKANPRYQLDDHGLWVLDDNGKVRYDDDGNPIRATEPDGSIFTPKTEKDVFDKLGIVWKEPHERDGFGALQSKDDGENVELPVSMGDLLSDTREFAWVD